MNKDICKCGHERENHSDYGCIGTASKACDCKDFVMENKENEQAINTKA
jgi:hypothetical protein